MTPKQIEKLQRKIADIQQALAAEKRKFGGYDDSRGLRYFPAKYYIQLGDFAGGLTYLRWFEKNFPNDGGFPDFLFEWTIILFKTGELKAAEKKAFQTFCRNTYLFDKFFNKPIVSVDKWEGSNLETPGFTDFLEYSSNQSGFADFKDWLDHYISTPDFISRSTKYIDIHKQLKTEQAAQARHYLVEQASQLEALG